MRKFFCVIDIFFYLKQKIFCDIDILNILILIFLWKMDIFAQKFILNLSLMKKITLSVLTAALVCLSAGAQGLQAAFGASEAMVPYYEMGWDSASEFDTWTYTSTSASTWKLGNASKAFSTIDSNSQSSMILNYNSGQNEVATSPAIDIRDNSQLEFYCYASGIYLVYGAWKLYAIADGQSTLLIDQFLWAQDNGYDGPAGRGLPLTLPAMPARVCSSRLSIKATMARMRLSMVSR